MAHTLTNVLNPFVSITALYTRVDFSEVDVTAVLPYVTLELLAAAAVAGYVLLMRRRSRVGDFWISARAERLTPALFLIAAFIGLLAILKLLDAPEDLFLLTLSMGLASATIAISTFFFKASAHCTVAGHAAAAGLFSLGLLGVVFAIALPLVVWARVALGAHTLSQTLAGAAVGAGFAVVFLV